MDKRTFLAKNWLKGNQSAQFKEYAEVDLPEGLPPLPTETKLQDELFPTFAPSNKNQSLKQNSFFVNGWSGESLQTKDGAKFNQIISLLCTNVRSQLHTHMFNRSLKQDIYNEFLSYCEFKAISNCDYNSYEDFWEDLFDETSDMANTLNQFIDIYCFRASVIYFFKIRFICYLGDKAKLKVNHYNLLNPNSFIIQTFKKASSSELITKAFQSNRYNWFRPHASLMHEVASLSELSKKLSISEIIKNISKSSQDLLEKNQYSHTFSHKNFGLFINSLLINYSNWFYSTQTGKLPKSITSEDKLEIVSCKFSGHFLESMSLSHWLAQENNLNIKWKQLLCPDFKGSEFETGMYMKLFNELQFLTFNIQIAHRQDYEIIPFLCDTMKSYRKNKKSEMSSQRSLFEEDISEQSSTYDKIVLNLSETPKNNPYFFIMNEINTQLPFLKDDGKVFLLCNKNIFIPSQKEKINSLLENFKFEACFNLEQIVGKGEIPHYIFVFSKITKKNQVEENERYSFPTFRLSGELTTFYDFSKLTTSLQRFFRDNLFEVPPYFQDEFESDLKIEYYTDALIDGRFISSKTKDTSQVTHPKFFSNLIKSCTRFDRLFDIYPLTNEKDPLNKDNDFFDSLPLYQFALVAIVDYRLANQTKVEIVPYKSFKAKTIEYGLARCQYFGLNPKISNLNLNIFREYFCSSLGQQVIDLTFTGNFTKFKSKLSALLFPKMFIDSKPIPDFVAKGFETLNYEESKLDNLEPKELSRRFQAIEGLMRTSFSRYPKDIMSVLTKFRVSILNLSKNSSIEINSSIFSNERLKEKLIELTLHPIYPNNQDVFAELHFTNPQDIFKELTRFKHIEKFSAGEILHGLELYNGDRLLITLYSKKELILFICTILNYILGKSMSYVLQSIQVPDSKKLENLIKGFSASNTNYLELLKRIDQLISSFFIISLNQNQ